MLAMYRLFQFLKTGETKIVGDSGFVVHDVYMTINNTNKNILIFICACVVLIASIYFSTHKSTPVVTTPVTTASTTTETIPGYKNTTYTVDGQLVTFVNGVSVVPSVNPDSDASITTQYFGDEATGDINGDGTPDIAFVITQNGGGSGTFYYAVAAIKTADGYQGTNAVLLGDRILPQSVQIQNGEVIVNYEDRNPTAVMTTPPSIPVTRYFKLSGVTLTEVSNPSAVSISYKNTQYGFNFTLPSDWTGYTIVKNTWTGNPLTSGTKKQTGPKLLIRNPKWTEANHYEDIPVLVFTLAQWKSYAAENFAVSAAPIPATELGRNNTYVFALPPRWDFDYSTGYQEADTIVQSNPLTPFNL